MASAIVSIEIEEKQGIDRLNQVVYVGVPFSNQLKLDLAQHRLTADDENGSVNVVVQPLACWPDGSIKWAICAFPVNLVANQSKSLELTRRIRDSQIVAKVEQSTIPFSVEMSRAQLTLQLASSLGTTINFAEGLATKVLEGEHFVEYQEFHGELEGDSEIKVTWQIRLDSWTNLTRHSVTVHNKKRAQHANGQWDLGDPNSFHFSSLSLQINNLNDGFSIRDVISSQTTDCGTDFRLTQYTSGGDNELSLVHVDRHNQVPFTDRGFQLETFGEQGKYSGRRINPVIEMLGESSFYLFVEHFWQSFPTSISGGSANCNVEFFPQLDYLHELQPGEKKTHRLWLSHDANELAISQASQPVTVKLPPKYIEDTNTIAFFGAELEPDIQQLINLGLDPKCGFEAKKELIDEYGWRSFGDLYADHENAECSEQRLIVSHYNNQYDPVYGFTRQFLKTGDHRWLTLANDLARHVTDIDIYDTDYDRAEYNKGLFWHTDHYVDAATASHRTYSVNQPSGVYEDHAGGGGPGGQHCYTSGLALHYLMTGEVASKQAVVELTHWMSCVYEGSGELLDFALAVKNSDTRVDLKNVKSGFYPLDRGTGNYIVALIDSFEVTQQQRYLDQASLVIKHTVLLDEDLSNRNLDKVEETWFYTVFLQAVCRYIATKSSHNQIDESYQYAVQVLLKFADWMAEYEQPYLLTPDILEFPNQTWTAQDLRKVNVLLFASLLHDDSNKYTKKAFEIRDYIVEQLGKDETTDYCRILCLLMQNEGMTSFVRSSQKIEKPDTWIQFPAASITPSLWREFAKRVKKTSLTKELTWLSARSAKIEKLLKRDN